MLPHLFFAFVSQTFLFADYLDRYRYMALLLTQSGTYLDQEDDDRLKCFA